MSLVGSLEDLGLGDILQIVSLSRKSGLLKLRSEHGEGRIVFHDGLVRGGFVKGEAEDLKDLLVAGGFVEEDVYRRAALDAEAHGDPLTDAIAAATNLTRERIDSLRREHVERSVFAMFGWSTGEFSFEVRDDVDDRDGDLMLPTGINPQYLTMEATRIGDEGGVEAEPEDLEFGTVDEVAPLDAEVLPDAAQEAAEALALASAQHAHVVEDEPEELPAAELEETAAAAPLEVAVVAEAEAPSSVCVTDDSPEAPERSAAVAPAPAEAPSGAEPATRFRAVIVIDPDLTALEWQKVVLGGLFERIHIFQAEAGGIERLRQYLRRGEQPALLVASTFTGDGARSGSGRDDLVARLRAHASSLPIFVVGEGDGPDAGALAPGVERLQRPPNHRLANRRAWPRFEAAGEAIRNAVRAALANGGSPQRRPAAGPGAGGSDEQAASAALRRLKQVSDRLRDPSAQGEVLSLIVDFAAEAYARVAIFMVRDDDAVAMVQSGLDRAGGPDAEAFLRIGVPADEPQWFREVLATRRGIVSGPRDDGDRRLAQLLGATPAAEAYVAPIESGNRVVALVYVDNLPGGEPIGDTASLEIVLHEAGLALERALLERALAEAGG